MPLVVHVLGACVFAMGTSEFMLAGLLPDIAADLDVSVREVGHLISAFVAGMIVGAPLMAVLTLRLPRRTTLVGALLVVAAGQAAGALAGAAPTPASAANTSASDVGNPWARPWAAS